MGYRRLLTLRNMPVLLPTMPTAAAIHHTLATGILTRIHTAAHTLLPLHVEKTALSLVDSATESAVSLPALIYHWTCLLSPHLLGCLRSPQSLLIPAQCRGVDVASLGVRRLHHLPTPRRIPERRPASGSAMLMSTVWQRVMWSCLISSGSL